MVQIHRRRFVQIAAGIGAALTVAPSRALGRNEQLNLGIIGLGGRGQEHLRRFGQLPDVRVAAICDPDQAKLSATSKEHPQAAQYTDLRKLLDNRDIDAVSIATCNHWHALAAIWACQAGKDVYVEKPLAHNHWEGQQVVRAARKYDRIVQVGTQQRSDPLQLELKDYLHHDRALGAIEYVQVCRFGPRLPIGKRATPLQPPVSVDYNLWLGPAADEPIYRDEFHYDWHWNWNTGNGEMGNWGVHVIDDAINVVLQDRVPFPRGVAAAGGRVAWNDAGETPNVCLVHFDTGAEPLFFALSNLTSAGRDQRGLTFRGVESGYVIQCEDGYYAGGRGGGTAYDRDHQPIRHFRGDEGVGHYRNFVDAVFTHNRNILNAEVQLGHQSTAWCNLADIALRLGASYTHDEALALDRKSAAWEKIAATIERHLADNSIDPSTSLSLSSALQFDAESESFIGANSEAANRLLRREYRQPFEVPAAI